MKTVYLKNFRKGLATNSSSTHSLIYRNEGEMFKDLDIFELDYYDRCDNTIAASREAKIKYVLAEIMHNEALVKVMSDIYPEMKQYFPKIKEATKKDENGYTQDEKFGMYNRGDLSFNDNLEASIDYLKNVIDDPEIIIIGGSDEQDFVYDTTEGHVECPTPGDVSWGNYSRFGVCKNGNYWVGYGDSNDRIVVRKDNDDDDNDHYCEQKKNSFGGKIRFATDKDAELVPEYPELIDLRITNQCDHGCKFCFMDSNMNGKHADIGFLQSVVWQCGEWGNKNHRRVEFSIGGGNILLYPKLNELFQNIHEKGHVLNVTIKAQDCEKVWKDKHLRRIFIDYVDGIGVSVTNTDEAQMLIDFKKKFNTDSFGNDDDKKYIVAHIIPEYLGVEKTIEIENYFRTQKEYVPKLYLGYKTNGRGASQEYTEFKDKDLEKIFENSYSISIDTTFANRYFWWIKDNFSFKHTITMNEGEFSMYIDGVTENAYKSSYQLDKPYNMHQDWKTREEKPYYNVKEAFALIRKDGGFTIYDEVEKHYWD